jgi:predicted AlkP superfamily phosphohydrolase/phosphomutase
MKLSLKLVGLVAASLLLPACGGAEKQSDTRVVVFGVDGLDPEMLQERIDRGMMPNFKKLVEGGANFQSLQTSWPPQSPVAWSNFISGTNPGKHGLYDFIHVNRETYGIGSSMVESDPVGMEMTLFGFDIPLTGGDVRSSRKAPAFWQSMSAQGVPVFVHRMPASYPLVESDAVVYPDMGTPDLTGAASGVSYLWTEDPAKSSKTTDSTRMEKVKLNRRRPELWKLSTKMFGPDDTAVNVSDLKAEQKEAEEAGNNTRANQIAVEIKKQQQVTTPVTFMIDNPTGVPQLAVEIEGAYAVAGLGEWSNWVKIEFGMLGGLIPVTGYTRFRFISAQPFEVYAVPVQYDPYSPASPISSPEEAAAELADAIGPYFVQGFADAYKSYKSEVLDTEGFIDESDMVLRERTKMMHFGLDQIDEAGGLLFLYTGSLDMRCHMLWHATDEHHPHQEAGGVYHGRPFEGMTFEQQIDRIYMQVDAMLGEMVARIEQMEAEHGTPIELIVMSDHGFAPFYRKMHINDWLVTEGYLVMKEGITKTGAHGLGYEMDENDHPKRGSGDIDWSKTKAYCVGFNGIILNRVDREPEGIVTEAEANALLDEITSKLVALTDGGKPVFTNVKRATEVFHGPKEIVSLAPDLQLGFNVGFGASDECAAGGVVGTWEQGEFIVDNDSRWSGSHLMDPELVRGTIIVESGNTFSKDPALEDITATLYSLFSLSVPEDMDGKPLY